jgi:hypothetical protein
LYTAFYLSLLWKYSKGTCCLLVPTSPQKYFLFSPENFSKELLSPGERGTGGIKVISRDEVTVDPAGIEV